MTTDTTPAAPTAAGLRVALAVIDRHAGAIKTGLSYWPPSGEVAAALVVARAAVARMSTIDAVAAAGGRWGDPTCPAFNAYRDADDAETAAVADLVALAVGGA